MIFNFYRDLLAFLFTTSFTLEMVTSMTLFCYLLLSSPWLSLLLHYTNIFVTIYFPKQRGGVRKANVKNF